MTSFFVVSIAPGQLFFITSPTYLHLSLFTSNINDGTLRAQSCLSTGNLPVNVWLKAGLSTLAGPFAGAVHAGEARVAHGARQTQHCSCCHHTCTGKEALIMEVHLPRGFRQAKEMARASPVVYFKQPHLLNVFETAHFEQETSSWRPDAYVSCGSGPTQATYSMSPVDWQGLPVSIVFLQKLLPRPGEPAN